MRRTSTLNCCVALLFVVAQPALGQSTETVRVVGEAGERSMAIAEAIVEAVRQVNGARIDSNREYHERFTEFQDTFTFEARGEREVRSACDGLVAGYRLLDENSSASGFVRVTLEVDVFVLDEPGENPMPSVAVVPFEWAVSEPRAMRIEGERYEPVAISAQLEEKVSHRLTHGRRFVMIERAHLSRVLDEQDLAMSDRFGLAEQVRVGRLLGADYILVGTVRDLQVERSMQRGGPDSGALSYVARAHVPVRMIDVARGRIAWSEDARVYFGDDEWRALKEARPELRPRDLLIEHLAAAIADPIVDAIHPMRVVDVGPLEVTMGRGGELIRRGDVYDVFEVGEMKYDLTTGRALEQVERLVARVRITRVTSKMSYGEVIEGDLEAIPVNAICRRNAERSPSVP